MAVVRGPWLRRVRRISIPESGALAGNISSVDVRASGTASAENAGGVAAPAPQCAPLTLFFPRFIEPATDVFEHPK